MVTKIVIDTNVFISVLIGQSESASRELFRQCLQGKYQPLMGNALLAEYLDVVNRDNITNLCPLTNVEKTNLLAAFMSVCQWIRVYYLWRPRRARSLASYADAGSLVNLPDEADNHLIELAVAGNAQIIATRNIKDFKRSQLKFPQLKIFKPEEVLNY
ncbi:putative toxin-antitoxin system toxin component, PIN family [Pleurocapsa sp. FMAR1]|uniref:putative toxin-antitoxin system toxin component, PIN family n=1 Tax=Pleurocapsa sp. FMAR1 TaxID=3040204 RepID=UPI0029C77337|nr:putative toxin-antitoxin system toxin component, PIN family [Pleurocapsa sp. FMAR1]